MFSIRRVAAATVLAGAGLLAVGVLPATANDSTPPTESSPSSSAPSSSTPSSLAPSSSAPSSSAPSSSAPSTGPSTPSSSPSTTTPPDECDADPGVKVDSFDGHAGTAQVSVTTEYEGQELCTDVYFLLASYEAEGADFPSSGHQTVHDTDGVLITMQGTYPLQVAVPDCYYQVDLYQADHELIAQDFDAPNDPLADYLVPGKHANGGDESCTPAPTGTLGSLVCSADGSSVSWSIDAEDGTTGDVEILVNGEVYDTVPAAEGSGTIVFETDGTYDVQLVYDGTTLADETFEVDCLTTTTPPTTPSTPSSPPTSPSEPSPTESSDNALPTTPSETPSEQPSSPGTTPPTTGGAGATEPADNGGIQTGSDEALPPPSGPELAETGASAPVLPLMAIGAGLLIGGIAMLVFGRRRSA